MGRYFFISGCAFAAFHVAGGTSAEVLDPLVGFLSANRTSLLASGLLGLLFFVCASLLFAGIGFANFLYLMAKAVYELVKLLLCAMSLASLIFWFGLGINLWLEGGGGVAVVLYAWLFGAAFCLRVFDFNYPVRETLGSYSALPVICLMVITISTLVL